MFIKLFYTVDKDAAILAGKSEWGTYHVELDPAEIPEDVREIVIKFADDDKSLINWDIYGDFDQKYRLVLVEPIDVARAIEILRDRISYSIGVMDRKYQKAINRCDDLKTLNLSDFSWFFGVDIDAENWDGKYLGRDVPIAIVERRSELVRERLQKIEKDRKAARLAAEREAAEGKKRAAEREAQKNRENHRAELRDRLVRETIEKLGDRDDIERYTANLIGPAEKSQIIGDVLFTAACDRYEKLDSRDLDHDEEYCNGNVEFTTGDPNHCTRDEWTTKKTIESAHQNKRVGSLDISYDFRFVEHVGTCDGCDAKIRALSVCVTAIAEEIPIATKHYAV